MAVLLALAGAAGAQPALPAERVGATVYVSAPTLARALGGHLRDGGDVLTVQAGDGGMLTVFAGDAEAVWSAPGAGVPEQALSAPAVRRDDGWWLPIDAAALLGMAPEPGSARLAPQGASGAREAVAAAWRAPDGRVWHLRVAEPRPPPAPPRAERVELTGGVSAVRLYGDGGGGGPEALSLMLLDLELLALAEPTQRARLDAALAPLRGRRALAALATALEPAELGLDRFTLSQDGRELQIAPHRWQTLEGDPARIAPDAPWWGVLWLPEGLRLDRPIVVRWREVEVEVRFRR